MEEKHSETATSGGREGDMQVFALLVGLVVSRESISFKVLQSDNTSVLCMNEMT